MWPKKRSLLSVTMYKSGRQLVMFRTSELDTCHVGYKRILRRAHMSNVSRLALLAGIWNMTNLTPLEIEND